MSRSIMSTPDIPDVTGHPVYFGLQQLAASAPGDAVLPGFDLLRDVACPSLGVLLSALKPDGGLEGLAKLKGALDDDRAEPVLVNKAAAKPPMPPFRKPTPPTTARPTGPLPPVQPPSRGKQRVHRKSSLLYSPLDRLTQKKNIDLTTDEGRLTVKTLKSVSKKRTHRTPSPLMDGAADSYGLGDMLPPLDANRCVGQSMSFLGVIDHRKDKLRKQLEAVHERSLEREVERRSKIKGRRQKQGGKLPALAASKTKGAAKAIENEGNRGRLLHDICKTYHTRVM
eukprot:TRINITY_DN10252_c0_g1_i1.p1 TRINITY_DN10252_c0_g1~~TRINITY_DN10252_c0_g1_i1.p1  ORF type:complete len:283 (+),score=95.17 TRINITY_DN10252_c0_g1_i1:50-898(+)